MQKSALVLIEFQHEWLDEAGKIHHLMEDKQLLQRTVIKAEQALEAARKADVAVIHVGLSFAEGHPELGDADAGLRHAIAQIGSFSEGEEGSQFVPPFNPRQGEFVVSGRTGGSAFAGSNLDSYLRNNRIEKLYLMGFALHVCVESTLRTGHDLGYDTVVIGDACAAFSEAQQQHVLEHVVHHFGSHTDATEFAKEIKAS